MNARRKVHSSSGPNSSASSYSCRALWPRSIMSFTCTDSCRAEVRDRLRLISLDLLCRLLEQ